MKASCTECGQPHPRCNRHVNRCTNCGRSISPGRTQDGTGCPDCGGTDAVLSPCMMRPSKGADVCKSPGHGGAAKQIRAAGKRRVETAKAEKIVRRLAIPIPGTNYVQALQDQLDLYHGIVEVLQGLVNDLDLDISRKVYEPAVNEYIPNGVNGIAGETYHQSGVPTGEAKPHVFVAMLADWTDRYSRLAIECAKIGIEVRRTEIAERLTEDDFRHMDSALDRAMAAFGVPSEFKKAFAVELRAEKRLAVAS